MKTGRADGGRRRGAQGGARTIGAGIAAAAAAAIGCGEPPGVAGPSGAVAGQVVVSGPLRGARITIEQIDLDSPVAAGRGTIAETVSDDHGRFAAELGAVSGLLAIVASGGAFDDLASGETVELDAGDELRSLTWLELAEQRDDVLVGPIGHLIEARTRARLPAMGDVTAAEAAAASELGEHFGHVAWTRVKLAGLDQVATSPTEPVRAALVHAALSYLVQDIALAAGASPQEVNVLAMTRLWASDLAGAGGPGDPMVFDGNDRNAKGDGQQLGGCPPVAACAAEPAACDVGEPRGACRGLCDLYANTPRALLAGALTKLIHHRAVNRTELDAADVLPVARAIGHNDDRGLFGDACIETLDRVPPTLVFATAPAPGALVRGVIAVQIVAIDDVDPSPRATIDGHPDADGDPDNSVAQAVIDTRAFGDGAFAIVARAVDRAGNQVTATRAVVIDNTPPALTVSDAGWLVQGGVRWSPDPAPVLAGGAPDAHGATITASIAGVAVAVAHSDQAGAWSLRLPAGALGTAPADVTLIAIDAAGNAAPAVVRRLAADAAPPVLSVLPSVVRNELHDAITFAPGTATPLHVHVDTEQTVLDAGPGCPELFKHAYLMVPGDANPIRWRMRAVDDGVGAIAGSARYRIGRDGGGPLGPWHPAPGMLDGATLELVLDATRSGDPVLGTGEGAMAIELAVDDALGRTATLRRCWVHHPLAAPLDADPAGRTAIGHPFALRSNRLDVATPFGRLAGDLIAPASPGLSVMDYDLVNGTLEPVAVTFTLEVPFANLRRDYARRSALIGVTELIGAARLDCTEVVGGCTPPAHPPQVTVSDPTITRTVPAQWAVRVFEVGSDGALSELPCTRCGSGAEPSQFVLPGKPTLGDLARRFRVMTVLRRLDSLAPQSSIDPDPGPFFDFALGGVTLTGKPLGASYGGCTRTAQVGPIGARTLVCVQLSEFQRYRALLVAEVAFTGPLRNRPASAPAPDVAPRSLGTLAAPRALSSFSYLTRETLPPGP